MIGVDPRLPTPGRPERRTFERSVRFARDLAAGCVVGPTGACWTSSRDPNLFGPDAFANNGPAAAAALADWSDWAARREDVYGLGATARDVLATVDASAG